MRAINDKERVVKLASHSEVGMTFDFSLIKLRRVSEDLSFPLAAFQDT